MEGLGQIWYVRHSGEWSDVQRRIKSNECLISNVQRQIYEGIIRKCIEVNSDDKARV